MFPPGDADSANVVFSSGASSVMNNDNLSLYVQGDQQAGVDNSSPFQQKPPITEHNSVLYVQGEQQDDGDNSSPFQKQPITAQHSPPSNYQIRSSGDLQTQDLFTRSESFDGNSEAVHVFVTNQASNSADNTIKVVMTQQGEILVSKCRHYSGI